MFVFREVLRFALIDTFMVMSFLSIFCVIVGFVDFVRTLCKSSESTDHN